MARTLEAAGRAPSVDQRVSAFAFNRYGIQVDKTLPRRDTDFCRKNSSMAVFGEPPSNPTIERDAHTSSHKEREHEQVLPKLWNAAE